VWGEWSIVKPRYVVSFLLQPFYPEWEPFVLTDFWCDCADPRGIVDYIVKRKVSAPPPNWLMTLHLYLPIVSFSCIQEGVLYSGVGIFNSLQSNIES